MVLGNLMTINNDVGYLVSTGFNINPQYYLVKLMIDSEKPFLKQYKVREWEESIHVRLDDPTVLAKKAEAMLWSNFSYVIDRRSIKRQSLLTLLENQEKLESKLSDKSFVSKLSDVVKEISKEYFKHQLTTLDNNVDYLTSDQVDSSTSVLFVALAGENRYFEERVISRLKFLEKRRLSQLEENLLYMLDVYFTSKGKYVEKVANTTKNILHHINLALEKDTETWKKQFPF